jgi:hypothetical protein
MSAFGVKRTSPDALNSCDFWVHTRTGPVRCQLFANQSIWCAFTQPYREASPMSTHSPERGLPAAPSRSEPKRRAIPRKVHQAIELIATGRVKTITAAAEHVGYARETLSRKLQSPECIAAMKARAAKEVALSAARAAARLTELVESASVEIDMRESLPLGRLGFLFFHHLLQSSHSLPNVVFREDFSGW